MRTALTTTWLTLVLAFATGCGDNLWTLVFVQAQVTATCNDGTAPNSFFGGARTDLAALGTTPLAPTPSWSAPVLTLSASEYSQGVSVGVFELCNDSATPQTVGTVRIRPNAIAFTVALAPAGTLQMAAVPTTGEDDTAYGDDDTAYGDEDAGGEAVEAALNDAPEGGIPDDIDDPGGNVNTNDPSGPTDGDGDGNGGGDCDRHPPRGAGTKDGPQAREGNAEVLRQEKGQMSREETTP